MPTDTEYQRLVANLFAARRAADAAHVDWTTLRWGNSVLHREMAENLDQARAEYWHAVDQLVAYILNH